jgi:hypothetical protein
MKKIRLLSVLLAFSLAAKVNGAEEPERCYLFRVKK